MNTPAGFEMKNGRMVNVQPLEAMFNSSFIVRAFHVVATAGMTMAFILAAIAAFNYYVINTLKIKLIIKSIENDNDSWFLINDIIDGSWRSFR